MKIQRNYKDSVFTLFFSEESALRDLYSAVSGVNVPRDIPLVINTLEDALFMGQINDISFTIGDRLVVLIEHQSSVNPNMGLRLLLYIARIYEKIVDGDNIYGTKPLKIPVPEFYVCYNGAAPYPDRKVVRLSDLYRDRKDMPALDLEVTVLNINEGHNREMLERSKYLGDYSAFIEKVREYESAAEGANYQERLGKAVTKALNWCVENGVLPEFLNKHGSEVKNMLLTEWDWDKAKAVWQREAREEGREESERQYQTERQQYQAEIAELKRQLAAR
jgi:hypothetical protein